MSISYQYTMLPSAAQLTEWPLHMAWEKGCRSENDLYKAIGVLSGALVFPISVACTPLTILADMITGVAEAIFMAYKGAERKDIQELLFKKIVVSPVQQVVNTVSQIFFPCMIAFVGLAFPVALPFIVVALPLGWSVWKMFGEIGVSSLPDSLNNKRWNIFLDGGTRTRDGQTFFENQAEKQAREEEAERKWQEFCNAAYQRGYQEVEDQIKLMDTLSDSEIKTSNDKYEQFKTSIRNSTPIEKILNLPQNFTQDDIKKAYKSWALCLHPDRHPPEKTAERKEATKLFQFLLTECERLKKELG